MLSEFYIISCKSLFYVSFYDCQISPSSLFDHPCLFFYLFYLLILICLYIYPFSLYHFLHLDIGVCLIFYLYPCLYHHNLYLFSFNVYLCFYLNFYLFKQFIFFIFIFPYLFLFLFPSPFISVFVFISIFRFIF